MPECMRYWAVEKTGILVVSVNRNPCGECKQDFSSERKGVGTEVGGEGGYIQLLVGCLLA